MRRDDEAKLRGYGASMVQALTLEGRKQRAKFRAWHRGPREADFMIGGFFDRYHAAWGEEELGWFEALLEEDDVDVTPDAHHRRGGRRRGNFSGQR